MKKITALFLLSVLITLSGMAQAAPVAPDPKTSASNSSIREEILSNGLKVIIVQDRSAPLAVFQIWYHAGSINEQFGKTGLSHLLEHMMFKGTPKYGPKNFSKIIQRAGGVDNAGTTYDYVFYYQKIAPEMLNISIELEADRMQNLIMDPKETLLERDVVMEERRMRYEDDPQNLVYEEAMSTAFKNYPYRWPVIGWMQDLKNMTREDLWEYYKTHYVPNNAVLIIAGDVNAELLMVKIKKEFGAIPRGADTVKTPKIDEPEQLGERRVFVKKEAELPYVFAGYKTPNISDSDSSALEVLGGIFSGGKSARIYKSIIKDKQIALSAGAGYSSINKYPSLFYFYGTPLPGKKIEDIESALYEEIEKIKKEPPTGREVQKAKNQIEAEFIMAQDSTFFQAEVVGQFEMLGDWRLKEKYLDGIRKVTPEDVQRIAGKYFIEDKRTVGILIPLKARSEK